MKSGVVALSLAVSLGGGISQAAANACGEALHLSVTPASRTPDVKATLLRRLESAGAVAPKVEAEGDGALRAVLPTGRNDTLLTRPARIEFHLIAEKPDAPNAIVMPRLDGKPAESVAPEIIVDETHMREFTLRTAPDPNGGPPGAVIAFRFDPLAVRNLMAATTEAVGRKLAIVIDGRIVADPIIRAPIASLGGEIPAGSLQSGSELLALLASGRLAGEVTVTSREPAPCKAP